MLSSFMICPLGDPNTNVKLWYRGATRGYKNLIQIDEWYTLRTQ